MLASSRATLPRRKRPGRIWNPPLQWVFHRAGIRPSHVAGRCRKACRGGACPSRKSRAAANTHGRDKSLPYEPRRARGQPGNRNLRVITNPCRGRCSHRPGQPRRTANTCGRAMALPYKPRQVRGQPGNHNLRVITNPCRGRCLHRPGQPRRTANTCGRDKSLPYDPRRARGQPGKCEPGDAATPCRGRCSHRPGNPAPPQTPAGGPWPSPTNHGRSAANRETTTSAL